MVESAPRDGGVSMSELSRDDVVSILGSISDAAIAEIIATGISKDQLIDAKAHVIQDHKTHNAGPSLSPGPLAQTVDILERLGKGALLGEAGSTLT
jgi:hypothetical protein